MMRRMADRRMQRTSQSPPRRRHIFVREGRWRTGTASDPRAVAVPAGGGEWSVTLHFFGPLLNKFKTSHPGICSMTFLPAETVQQA